MRCFCQFRKCFRSLVACCHLERGRAVLFESTVIQQFLAQYTEMKEYREGNIVSQSTSTFVEKANEYTDDGDLTKANSL